MTNCKEALEYYSRKKESESMKKACVVGAGNTTGMTVDEAIKHCYEVAKKQEYCTECAQQHLTLATWLEELKELRKFKHDVARAFMPK